MLHGLGLGLSDLQVHLILVKLSLLVCVTSGTIELGVSAKFLGLNLCLGFGSNSLSLDSLLLSELGLKMLEE